MIKISTARERQLLAAAAAVALIFAADRIIWRPLQRARAELDARLRAQMRTLEHKRWTASHKDEILKKYGPEPSGQGEPAASADMRGSALLNHLADMARRSGAKIRDFKPLREKGSYSGATVLVSAAWPALARFLTEVESSFGGLQVQKLTVTRDGSKGLVCQMTLQPAQGGEPM